MVRVLHCTGNMDCGGIETFIMNVYRSIDREKVQFDFLLDSNKEYDYNEEIRQLGGRIFCAPGLRQGILKSKRLRHAFFVGHPEYQIIHYHVSSASFEVLKIAKKHSVKTRIIHGHNIYHGGGRIATWLHLWNRHGVRSYATHYFACSEPAALWMYGKKQLKRKEHSVINNGIDVNAFKYDSEKRKSIREELGLEDAFVIGHVGRFMSQKNHTFLVDIYSEVAKQYDNAVLLMIGDGKLCGGTEEKVAQLGLTRKVVFTGVRSDMPALFSAMDVFVFPSLYEGLGMVLVEAQTSGLPCVASADVIPAEAKMSRNFMSVPLVKPPAEWAKVIIGMREMKVDRAGGADAVRKAGYDIGEVAGCLEKFYLGETG